jgi:hypothetical protein
MPQEAWSAKRVRQYAHIKDSLLERGKPEPLAEDIAARVVNKAPVGRTLLQLRDEARQRGVKGRSTMNKVQLEAALTR